MPTLLRDTLFGDLPLDRWPADPLPPAFPWSAFAVARSELAAAHSDFSDGCQELSTSIPKQLLMRDAGPKQCAGVAKGPFVDDGACRLRLYDHGQGAANTRSHVQTIHLLAVAEPKDGS